jgi:hypothetical protein
MELSKYWERIKLNIENLYLNDFIKENYSYESFCNDFIPQEISLKNPITDRCMCNHNIKNNYTYTHKTNKDEFILGSCCIKIFSTIYKNKRICIDCNITIRKNKDNICSQCKSYRIIEEAQKREKELKEQQYRESCKCKGCGYQKKDNKYKYCFICYKKKYNI